METVVDSIKAAVEAKCLCDCHGQLPEVWCTRCKNTGLKHPSLSRVCPGVDIGGNPQSHYDCKGGVIKVAVANYRMGAKYKTITCETCNGSGRVPDVTLEKVFECLADLGESIHIGYGPQGREVWLAHPGYETHWADTWTEAAYKALLEVT